MRERITPAQADYIVLLQEKAGEYVWINPQMSRKKASEEIVRLRSLPTYHGSYDPHDPCRLGRRPRTTQRSMV